MAWGLGYIASQSDAFKDLILDQEGVKLLANALSSIQTSYILENGICTLTILTCGKPEPEFEKVKDAIPIFCSVLKNETKEKILRDAAQGLFNLGEYRTDEQSVIPVGVIPVLLQHLE